MIGLISKVGHSSENLSMAKSKNRSWIKQHVKDPYVQAVPEGWLSIPRQLQIARE